MNPLLRLFVVLTPALAFSFLFYQSSIGINWSIFITLLVIASSIAQREKWGVLRMLSVLGVWLPALSVGFLSSGWAMFVSVIALAPFSGMHSNARLTRPFYALFQATFNLVFAYINFLLDFLHLPWGLGVSNERLKKVSFFVVPSLIILVFILLYSWSSPFFEAYLGALAEYVDRVWIWISKLIKLQWVALFILGSVISIYVLARTGRLGVIDEPEISEDIQSMDVEPSTDMERKSVLFLLVALNVLLMFFNALDLHHVWLHFDWNGEYLKQFVHEGTWMLVASIVLAIVIVVFYFRGGLNFVEHPWLKRLSYLWLAQNIFLIGSVFVRNMHYMHHFSLAYKRIAVVFFLWIVLVGVLSVIWKLRYQKNLYYVLRINGLSVYVAVVLSALFPWDVIITRYNLAHRDTGYVHFSYLAQMDDSALPYLQLSLEEWKAIEADRNARYPAEVGAISAEDMHDMVQERTDHFYESLEGRTWKDWTWLDYWAKAKLNTLPEH